MRSPRPVAQPRMSADRFKDVCESLHLLASPDSGAPLTIKNKQLVTDDEQLVYPLMSDIPVLFPASLRAYLENGVLTIPYEEGLDPLLQYIFISSVKWRGGEQNASPDEPSYIAHLHAMKNLLASARGTILDIGCDNPSIGTDICPSSCKYLGLDPFLFDKSPYKLVALAEFLPLLAESFDNIMFNTSLDHILDWHRAIDEARRVLKKGGGLFLASLVWHESAELFHDSVHFHHFRESELIAALNGFRVEAIFHRKWKDNSHRRVLYLSATKL